MRFSTDLDCGHWSRSEHDENRYQNTISRHQPYVRAPADLQSPLNGDIRSDVAIVGGGFSGLSTALALKKSGVYVAVIERKFCGFGASGRNAGHLTPTICKDLPTAVMLFGDEKAAELVRFAVSRLFTLQWVITVTALRKLQPWVPLWLGIRALMRILTGFDNRTDKAIRKQGF